MMKRIWKGIILIALSGIQCSISIAQSMHFSQYYNAPVLLNPANTALMPDYDYRFGANFRNQWATVPVPYSTTSVFGDFKVASQKSSSNNWLGIGLAYFNDKAGDGNLALNQIEGSVAYHLSLNYQSLLSFGLSGAYTQRSVNFDNLTFDSQWDGFSFNTSLPNAEKIGILKTNYSTVGAGLNYSYFPNDNFYLKLGFAMANINQPVESFYGDKNQIAMRPTANAEATIQSSSNLIITPSIYYTEQLSAYELIYGSEFQVRLKGSEYKTSELILGIYNRFGESVIGVAGFQYNGIQFTASYDFTVSSLAPYNSGYGALEFSLIYKGLYHGINAPHKMYNCPRFF